MNRIEEINEEFFFFRLWKTERESGYGLYKQIKTKKIIKNENHINILL